MVEGQLASPGLDDQAAALPADAKTSSMTEAVTADGSDLTCGGAAALNAALPQRLKNYR